MSVASFRARFGWAAVAAVIAGGTVGSMGCSGDTPLQTCDIRQSDCQLDVLLAVQDVRGQIWDPWLDPPPMRVISEDEYRSEVVAARERSLRESGGRDLMTEALKLLSMIDPDETPSEETDFRVATVAAYYNAVQREVTIIDRKQSGREKEDVQTLAHELVHAAQDRDIGFDRLYRNVNSQDSSRAVSVLLEGEATVYALLVDAKQIELPIGLVDWRILSRWTEDVRQGVFDSRSPYRVANTELVYPLGGEYVGAVYEAEGPLGVRRVFDSPPRTTMHYMVGRDDMLSRAQPPAWSCGVPDAPTGLSVASGDELGGLNAYAFATRVFQAERQAWSTAQAWTGDRFYIYASESDETALAVVWLMRFQSPETAELYQTAIQLASLPRPVATFVQGDTLHLYVTRGEASDDYDAWRACSAL